MDRSSFFLALMTLLPLIGAYFANLCRGSKLLVEIIHKLIPIICLISLFQLQHFSENEIHFDFGERAQGLKLSFATDQNNLGLLFLLNGMWIIFTFYSSKFIQLSQEEDGDQLKIFALLTFAFLNLLALSNDPASCLLFYSCLSFLSHSFFNKFLHKKEKKRSPVISFLLYLQPIIFFFAIIASYKIIDTNSFLEEKISLENFNSNKVYALFAAFFIGLFLFLILPSYLFFRDKIILNTLRFYQFFFLICGCSAFLSFFKIEHLIFDSSILNVIVKNSGFHFFELIFLISISIVSFFMMRSSGIKSSFLYLFFHQFIFALFSFFLLTSQSPGKAIIAPVNFSLSFTLVFFTISNLSLFFLKSKNKSPQDLLHRLPITSSLLIFSFINLLGIAPTIGAVEKFLLLKIIWKKELWLSALILLTNFGTLTFLLMKFFYPLFLESKSHENPSKETSKQNEEFELEKLIDFDSSLALTSLTLAISMIVAVFYFLF